MTSIVQAIQKLIQNTMHAMDPTQIVVGIVEEIDPLKIRISNKLILTEENIYLTKNVMDYKALVKFDKHITEIIENHEHINGNQGGMTGSAGKHFHQIIAKGEKEDNNSHYQILNHLNIKDQVLMIQQQGGQKYIVIDQIYSAKKEEIK